MSNSAHLQALRHYATEIHSAPPLRRTNGFGVGLYGWLRDEHVPGAHWKLYFVSAIWLPILPLCAYLVQSTGDGFRFYRRLDLINLCRIYRSRVFGLYVTALIEGIGWMMVFIAVMLAAVLFVGWLFGRL